MKKTISTLLVLCMLLGLLPFAALADSSGSCGEHAFWTLDEEGTLTISGTGATDSCYSFVYNQAVNTAPWYESMDDIRRVVIEEGITELGMWSFMPAHNLESVQLPESLIIIGSDAFAGCTSLREVRFPTHCTELGQFSGCEALEHVTLPPALEVIPIDCFDYCTSLKEIELPPTVRELGEYCFSHTGITELHIPDGVETLPNGMCMNCKNLQKVTFSDSVRTIPSQCFAGCSSLENVSDSKSLETIEWEAFLGCSKLQSIRIPEMTEIPMGMLSGCSSLREIEIPETVQTIRMSAFYGCESLEEIVLPSGLKTIERGAFSTCTGLKYMVIPASVTSIGEYAFSTCSSMEWIAIPDSVTELGSGAFAGCTSLQSLRVPAGVAVLRSELFSGCSNLEWVLIPLGVTVIQSSVFNGCHKLKGLEYPGTEQQMDDVRIEMSGNEVVQRTPVYLIPAYPDYWYGFYDMPEESEWSYEGISYCLDNGFMNGMGDGYFQPNATTTRAQLVTILWRMCEEPAAEKAADFRDTRDHWAKDAVAWAAENGIVNGVGEGLFAPDAPITREQLVTIFHRFCKDYLQMDVSQTQTLSSFPDAGAVSDWAKDAMEWGVAVRLISGVSTPDGAILQPQGSATRAQIAKVILNFFEYVYAE